jgi:aminoglycoside phosphotransferase (APT) family kinase protein
MSDDEPGVQPPPAEGVRLPWPAVPAHIRGLLERQLGSAVASATSQPTGFSPGVAARLLLADGRHVFVKAAGPEPNLAVPAIHRREAQVVAALPAAAPVPRLLWSHDDPGTGWVLLLFEAVAGRTPAQPWRAEELERVLAALVELGAALTPAPLAPPAVKRASEAFGTQLCGWGPLLAEGPATRSRLDPWSARHLEALAALEAEAPAAVAGDTLLHFDVRADNMLLTPERIWFVDWPLACVGAPWVDVVFFAPSVAMQGGPPPEALIARHPAARAADPAALTAVVASVAGFFTHRALQPPPPGLPTVRAFQAAQGAVARAWLAQRAPQLAPA